MIRIVLCDDEKYMFSNMQKYCRKFEIEHNIEIELIFFDSGEEFLKSYDLSKNIDVIFLDIKMKEVNGIEVAKEIRKTDHKVCLFFLTSLRNHSLDGYKVRALNYLIKPLKYGVFKDELEKAIKEITVEESKLFGEKTDKGLFNIYFRELIFIETESRNTLLHTINGETILSYKKMKEHETILDSRFFRCYTAYIVNMSFVKNVENNMIVLRGSDLRIPIAKKRRKEFMEALTNYLCNQL